MKTIKQLYLVRIKPELVEEEQREMEDGNSVFKPSIIDGCLASFGQINKYSRGEAIKKARMFNGTIEKAPENIPVNKEPSIAKQSQDNKLNEHILIASIISDNHMKKIYDDHAKHGVQGYFDALDIIKEATKAFYAQFKRQIETVGFEWQEFFDILNKTPYLSQVVCYDDLVIEWSKEWLRQYFTSGRQTGAIKM